VNFGSFGPTMNILAEPDLPQNMNQGSTNPTEEFPINPGELGCKIYSPYTPFNNSNVLCYLHSWPLDKRGTQFPQQLHAPKPWSQVPLGILSEPGNGQSFPGSWMSLLVQK